MKFENIRVEDFLKIKNQFHLGFLPTEKSHPKTKNLSHMAQYDPAKGINALSRLDESLYDVLLSQSALILQLANQVRKVRADKGRIFLSGCGATGRLSLVLETMNLKMFGRDDVISFMAGGDAALIKSIEDFEDHPEFGERQLMDLGFSAKDMLIGITEGGETPFVIGSTLKGAEVSQYPVFFLYCNPTELLSKRLQRCHEVLTHDSVIPIELLVGPMALSGSTRMQASSIQMLALALCILYEVKNEAELAEIIESYREQHRLIDWTKLVPFIKSEARLIKKKSKLLYQCGPDLGITVLTDTTERSPTFSILPFENKKRADELASYYLYFNNYTDSKLAWWDLLEREPRALNWKDYNGRVDSETLYNFDFSEDALKRREKESFEIFKVNKKSSLISFELMDERAEFHLKSDNLFFMNYFLKLLLNTHSTLVMGRLGRYEGNVMIWVRPSNLKLIDRSIRYIQLLSENIGITVPYDDAAHICFETMLSLKPNDSVVIKSFQAIKKLLNKSDSSAL